MLKEIDRYIEDGREVVNCELNGEVIQLEPAVIPLVDYFNSVGLKTIMSCEGHNNTNMSMFWIDFSTKVTDDDIKNFLFGLNEKYGSAATFGKFAKAISVGRNNEVHFRWRYMAATKNSAACDWVYFTTGRRAYGNLV
jgi:hypothetical protein